MGQEEGAVPFTGVGVEQLPALMYEMYLRCVADARSEADPREDFDAFVDRLWGELSTAFGLVRQDWPDDAPRPWTVEVDDRRGEAEAVLEGQVRRGELPL